MIKKRILLVDDEEDLAFSIRVHLERNDYEVIMAVDGQEALNKVRKEKPDLIILDVMLPKIDGYRVCRMLKFDQKYASIPIIMLTARIQPSDKQSGLDVGANVYFTKPIESEILLNKIKELLNEKE